MSTPSTPNPLDPPVSKTIVKTINNFTVNVRNVVLNTSATLEVYLYNNTEMVDFQLLTLSGSDYAAWGVNDQYIITWTANWIRANYPS